MGADVQTAQDHRTHRMTPRDTERLLITELIDAIRANTGLTQQVAEKIGGQAINNVLAVETCIFPAAGDPVPRSWKVAAGSVIVENYSAVNVITVHAAGPSSSAPPSGVGVYRVPPGHVRTINVASNEVTFYGTIGDAFAYQALTNGGTGAVAS